MVNGSETSSHTPGHHATLGGAILLRQKEHVVQGPLLEVELMKNLTQVTSATTWSMTESQQWHRIAYMNDEDKESWRDRRARSYTIDTYPRIVPPGTAHLLYEDEDDYSDVEEEPWMADLTRYYPQIDSADEEYHMERKEWPRHDFDPDNCRPMHEWQSTSFPVCNTIHETNLGDGMVDNDFDLISNKGFWRHAWKTNDLVIDDENTTIPKRMVWKTFK